MGFFFFSLFNVAFVCSFSFLIVFLFWYLVSNQFAHPEYSIIRQECRYLKISHFRIIQRNNYAPLLHFHSMLLAAGLYTHDEAIRTTNQLTYNRNAFYWCNLELSLSVSTIQSQAHNFTLTQGVCSDCLSTINGASNKSM